MKNDIFNESANLSDSKWWSGADGRLLLPALIDGASAPLYLARNDACTEWSVARVNANFELEDISNIFPSRNEAIKAAGEMQRQGKVMICYATAKCLWIDAVENGGTL